MAKLVALPNELWILIVGHLQDEKIHHFDPLATRDLQSVRLVSRTMSAIATPLLFKNMVYDLKFYREQDLNRLVDFARTNPELAKDVRRIQVKVPPTINIERTLGILRKLRMNSKDYLDMPQVDRVDNTLKLTAQTWKDRQKVEKQRVMDGTSATGKISMLLPNLRHLEHGISTYQQQEFVSIKDKILTDNGVMYLWQHQFPVEQTKEALRLGLQIVHSNITKNLVSLKSRDVPVWLGIQTFKIQSNLQHLNLEMRVGRIPTNHSDFRKFKIKKGLQALTQLKTLRLGLLQDDSAIRYHVGFRVDDLLVNPQNTEVYCFFPRLERLELFDCTCRLNGLSAFFKKHQQTLKQLVLNRITLSPDYASPSWNEVAATCKEAVPGLTYLRLTKLVTRHSTLFNNNVDEGVSVKPTSKTSWRAGMDDAMTYEWTKGGANGTDMESIGLRCPWTSEDALEGDAEDTLEGDGEDVLEGDGGVGL